MRSTAPIRPDWLRTWRPTITFSSAVISANRRMFWKVRAMPAWPPRAPRWACRGAAELEAARVGRVQAGDDVEEGGLAGAVRADQAVDLAGLLIVMPTSERACRPPKRLETPATLRTVSLI